MFSIIFYFFLLFPTVSYCFLYFPSLFCRFLDYYFLLFEPVQRTKKSIIAIMRTLLDTVIHMIVIDSYIIVKIHYFIIWVFWGFFLIYSIIMYLFPSLHFHFFIPVQALTAFFSFSSLKSAYVS
jgi:hypothetical protein